MVKKTIQPKNVDGTTIRVNDHGQLEAVGSGLDCEQIAQLPVTTWKQGTSILVSQDGVCKRLLPQQDVFQDVAVHMGADKTSGLEGNTFKLTFNVTNLGNATNEHTTLTIIKPSATGYTVTSQTHTIQGGEIEKVSDTQYELRNLVQGANATITWIITADKYGSYRFGASINTRSIIDKSTSDNSASITLNITSRTDPNLEVTVDCPAIIGTYKGAPLIQSPYKDASYGSYGVSNGNILSSVFNLNILDDDDVYTIHLQNASTVYIKSIYYESYRSYAHLLFNAITGKRIQIPDGYSDPNVHDPSKLDTLVEYTPTDISFDPHTGILTIPKTEFNGRHKNIFIYARPQGANCRWQLFVVNKIYDKGITPLLNNTITITGIDSALIHRSVDTDILTNYKVSGVSRYLTFTGPYYIIKDKWQRQVFYKGNLFADSTSSIDGSSLSDWRMVDLNNDIIGEITTHYGDENITEIFSKNVERVDINLPAGTAYNFTVKSTNNYALLPQTAGKTQIVKSGTGADTTYTVTVAADATATDSIRGTNININIVE